MATQLDGMICTQALDQWSAMRCKAAVSRPVAASLRVARNPTEAPNRGPERLVNAARQGRIYCSEGRIPDRRPAQGTGRRQIVQGGFAEPERSGASGRKDLLTFATEFCNTPKAAPGLWRAPLSAPFCTRHLQHARPFVYGPPADDAKLISFETANGVAPRIAVGVYFLRQTVEILDR